MKWPGIVKLLDHLKLLLRKIDFHIALLFLVSLELFYVF